MTFKINGKLLCIEELPKTLNKEQLKRIAINRLGTMADTFVVTDVEYVENKYLNLIGYLNEK